MANTASVHLPTPRTQSKLQACGHKRARRALHLPWLFNIAATGTIAAAIAVLLQF